MKETSTPKVTLFQHRVYKKLLEVPPGKVTTYKDLACAIGTRAYRAVGMALNKNPFAPKVPCHRVVNSDGSLGGFAAGCENKIKLLKREGVEVQNCRMLEFESLKWKFSKKCISHINSKMTHRHK